MLGAWSSVEPRFVGAISRHSTRWATSLYVLYFDSARKRLLYINNSANDGVFEDPLEAVLGAGAVRFNGTQVYRVMGDVQRLVPTNVGVLMLVVSSADSQCTSALTSLRAFTAAEAGTKTQTNISGSGFREGERVNISVRRRVGSGHTRLRRA